MSIQKCFDLCKMHVYPDALKEFRKLELMQQLSLIKLCYDNKTTDTINICIESEIDIQIIYSKFDNKDIFKQVSLLPSYSTLLTTKNSIQLQNLIYACVISKDNDCYNMLSDETISKLDLTQSIEKACEIGNLDILERFMKKKTFQYIIVNSGINVACYYGQYKILCYIMNNFDINFVDKLLIMMIENSNNITSSNKYVIIEYLFTKLPKTISLLDFLNDNVAILEIFHKNRSDFDEYYGTLFMIACEQDNLNLLIWLENKKYVYKYSTAVYLGKNEIIAYINAKKLNKI